MRGNVTKRARRKDGFGHGHWSRAQLVAIVAEYWRKGWSVEHVSVELGVSEAMVASVFANVEWTERDVESS